MASIDYASIFLEAAQAVALGVKAPKSDKTEICEVFSEVVKGELDKTEGQYRVFNGSRYYIAYTSKESGMSFEQGDYVYVKIPQGNYNAKKLIENEYAVEDKKDYDPFENYELNQIRRGISVENIIIKEKKNEEGTITETVQISSYGDDRVSLIVKKEANDDEKENGYIDKQGLIYNFNPEDLKDKLFLGIGFDIITGFGGYKGSFQIEVEFLKQVGEDNETDASGQINISNQNDRVIFRKVLSEKDIYGNPYLIRSPKNFKFMVTTKNNSITENEQTTSYTVSDIYKCRIKLTSYAGFDFPGEATAQEIVFDNFQVYAGNALSKNAFDELEDAEVEKAIIIQGYVYIAMETIKLEDYDNNTSKYIEALIEKTKELYEADKKTEEKEKET